MSTIIIIAILVLLVLWVISVQRKLVNQEELCKNALSQIGVQQSSRWDALTALAELIKSYDEHEYNTIANTIAMRSKITGESSTEDAQRQENMLSGAFKNIIAVAERYPELKASEMYGRGMESVNTYENQVRTSRMVYNDTVTKFNRVIRQIPDSFVASLFHFQQRSYLEEPVGKTDMPSMRIK